MLQSSISLRWIQRCVIVLPVNNGNQFWLFRLPSLLLPIFHLKGRLMMARVTKRQVAMGLEVQLWSASFPVMAAADALALQVSPSSILINVVVWFKEYGHSRSSVFVGTIGKFSCNGDGSCYDNSGERDQSTPRAIQIIDDSNCHSASLGRINPRSKLQQSLRMYWFIW